MENKMDFLVPSVQSATIEEGQYILPLNVKINFGKLENKFNFCINIWLNYTETVDNSDILIVYNKNIKSQGYRLTVKSNIVIEYSEECGVFYAFLTLRQIVLKYNNTLPCMTIEDWPDINQRGLMLDVSRGRITRIEVIKEIVDWLACLKYNQLQLYFDAIIFDYPGMEEFTADKVLYTPEEIKDLSDYCAKRFMTLVPNQNSFAHMSSWTSNPKVAEFAITCDDGKKSGTLNPLSNLSIEFMNRIYGSLLPYFDSNLINIGCDETWDLGQGETKSACQELGNGVVYLDYLMKLYDLVKNKFHCTPMFWDDIAMKHPELIPKLPKDMIVLEWGYEFDHPFEEHCKILRDLDLRFYVAPGTSTWNSVCGRSVNMAENIRNSAKYSVKYNAEGYLLTDWGDSGQPQPLACSIPAYVLGGMYSWHVENRDSNSNTVLPQAADYANKFIFDTEFNLFGWIFRLGKYSHFENVRILNDTQLWQNFRDCHPIKYPLISFYSYLLLSELKDIKLGCKYSSLIVGELKNVCRWLHIVSSAENMRSEAEIWKKEYIEHWNMRSKHDPKGYGINTKFMDNFIEYVECVIKNGDLIPLGVSDVNWYY